MVEFLAERYCEDVLAGRVVACRWVRLACERHRRDLVSGGERGLYFDSRAAKVAVAFFNVLKHSKGEWAGQTVRLEGWQQFVLWCLFGWRKRDGTRRFRTAYLEVARKNGKSTFASGIGLYLLTADGEPGAEVYTAATKRDQARITHGEATRMVGKSRELKKYVKMYKDNLHVVSTASKFVPLGRDNDSLDGLNVHGVIADEVHAWPNRDLWDVLETATGARRQPLMVAITTAGSNRQSLCRQLHDYSKRILEGVVEDDSFWGVVYSLDEGDDWWDEGAWVKANPNLGVSKKLEDMRQLAGRAREMPAQLNAFLRLHLDMWTEGETRWMNPDKWRLCGKVPGGEYSVISGEMVGRFEAALQGRRCCAGLDLSSTTDISALVHVFEPVSDGEPYWVLPRFWIPEENMRERSRRDRVPYEAWQQMGLLTATPGNVIDYSFILGQLQRDMELFELGELAFDRWGSQKLITDLQAIGFTVEPDVARLRGVPLLVQFGQGFASMSAPMKELEKLVLSGMIGHGGHPVLSWMADNVVARVDPAGNVKPDKERSREKIDGVVGLIMGLDRVLRRGGGRQSVYSTRGIRTI